MKRISLSGIYGAPTVVTIFGPKNCLYSVPDAFCAEIHSVLSKKFFKKKILTPSASFPIMVTYM